MLQVLKKHVTQICDFVPRRFRNIGTKRDYPYTFSPPLAAFPMTPAMRDLDRFTSVNTFGHLGRGVQDSVCKGSLLLNEVYWAAVILTYRAMLKNCLTPSELSTFTPQIRSVLLSFLSRSLDMIVSKEFTCQGEKKNPPNTSCVPPVCWRGLQSRRGSVWMRCAPQGEAEGPPFAPPSSLF